MTTWSDAENRTLGKPVRDHLGQHLRNLYHGTVTDQLPKDLASLVRRLERAIQARAEGSDPEFMGQLMKAVPNLRAMAMSRTRDVHRAEDLVQETILKAWDKRSSFERGTNLEAWLFTILRNEFFSQHRKRSREVEDVDGSNAGSLIALPDQVDRLEMQDLSSALVKLVPEQREALILVGVEGLSYEDAARAMGVATGTMKSRVNRARTRLAQLLGMDPEDAGGKRLQVE